MLVQAGETNILLDAGVGVRLLQKRLSKLKVTIQDLDAVLLTHEHGDHARAVLSLSKRYCVPVIANPATLDALSDKYLIPTSTVMDTGTCLTLKDLMVESFPISHDAVDPVGYNIHYRDWKASFVTDTGIAGSDILEKTADANLMILESNHDIERLINGPYPQFLKRRILSDVGHLSNKAAADFILEHIGASKQPACIWLAHLSDTNNTPRLARRYVQKRLSDAGCGNVVLDVAMRDMASLTWRPGRAGCQMNLF